MMVDRRGDADARPDGDEQDRAIGKLVVAVRRLDRQRRRGGVSTPQALGQRRDALVGNAEARGQPVCESGHGRVGDQQVDGLILFPVDPSDPFWSVLAAALPVVSIGERLAGAATAGEVLFDNRAGVRRALEHLHALGHRRVAVLRPPGSPTNDRPAELFVVSEADRLGLEVQVVTARYELREATELANRVLTEALRPTAVFCFSDSIAYGVYAAARELGVAIPAELSVIGYDDHPISTLLSPPLTSFSWGSKRLIEVAVQMLLAAMEGDASVRRRVTTLAERYPLYGWKLASATA